MGEALQVEEFRDERSLRLVVHGELDEVALARFEKITTTGVDAVEVDLGDVTFIASGGIRALLVLRERTQSASGTFRVIRTSATVSRVFEMTNLTDTFLDGNR